MNRHPYPPPEAPVPRAGRRAILLLPPALLAAPAHAAPDDAILRALNRALVEQVVLPGYRRFTSVTANLTARLDALSRAPGEAQALESARQGFADTLLAWEGVQHIRSGPADLFSRHARIQLWPDPQDRVSQDLERAIAQRDTSLLEIRSTALNAVSVQGLPALERLLFGEGAAEALAAGDAGAGYRAALLRAIGGNLAALGRDLLAGWTGGEAPHAVALAEPRAPYATPQDATLDLLRALHAAVAAVADRKLGPALGAGPAEARPKALECWRSRLSGQAIRANVDAAAAMVLQGFAPALDSSGEGALAATLRQACAELQRIAGSLPLPLEDAIQHEAERELPLRLQGEAAALKVMLAQRVPPPLGLSGIAEPLENAANPPP
ncbi:imelysin family protein [Teichococcus oryzae]|uniref:Imelysin family protein n=1 Tax=Teichococcus oryzae TaxID=1608942 RepID=A0A5B2TJX0_9PROT|nr:imelysin family protein [Pseudoroseomonas oryzae]KAA2214772.1 imelysin family protein [Pseudoroseomonas oryzae]